MADVYIRDYDEVYLEIVANAGILMELSEQFCFDAPGMQYDFRVRNGTWDGKIRLLNRKKGLLYKGLHGQLISVLKDFNYTYETEIQKHKKDYISVSDIRSKVPNLTYEPKQHQVDAINIALNSNCRRLLICPTGSGKSYIMYILSRLLNAKTLILVPTINLVYQMQKDFAEYGYKKEVQTILGGKTKITSKDIVVSTWQSAYKQDHEWFNQFDLILGDEAHTFKGKSLCSLMEKTTNVKYKVGLTGTLDGHKVHELIQIGLFGPTSIVATTNELIKNGTLSKVAPINILKLEYDKVSKKRFGKANYADQIRFITSNEKRTKLIVNLAAKTKNNTLVLFNLVDKHGKIIYNKLLEKNLDKKIFFIYGDVGAEIREKIREITEVNSNVIIVASYACFSTGVNIKNLHNVIFASPMKSKTKILQSIGRLLRLHESKDSCNIFDIADDLSFDGKNSLFLRQLLDRIRYYVECKFNYKITKILL